jgi:superfamily II DNA or RNA helicase
MFMGQHSFLLEDSGAQRQSPQVRTVAYSSPQRISCGLTPAQLQKLKTTLTHDPVRNKLLRDIILALAEEGRQILVLSDRTAHLDSLMRMFEEDGGGQYRPGLYVGGQKRPERERVERECGVLFGTFAMAQEGLDIPRLDTLVFATPASDITQAVGRILRPCGSKKPPIIVDLQDDACVNFRKQNQIRGRFYAKHGIHPVEGAAIEEPAAKRLRGSCEPRGASGAQEYRWENELV